MAKTTLVLKRRGYYSALNLFIRHKLIKLSGSFPQKFDLLKCIVQFKL